MDIEINGSLIRSLDGLHRALALELDFPAHYGRNPDALWDCLINDIQRPVTVVLANSVLLEQRLGKDFAKVLDVFEDVKTRDAAMGLEERFDYLLA